MLDMGSMSVADIIDLYDKLLPFPEYIGMYLPNEKQYRTGGESFKMNCPIHEETTPSFLYNDGLRHWTCFGACDTSGKTVKFHFMYLRKLKGDGVSMAQAIIDLQKSFPHILPKWTPRKDKVDITATINRYSSGLDEFYKPIKIKSKELSIENRLITSFLGKQYMEFIKDREKGGEI